MNFHVLTLFPEMIEQGINTSITGRAIEKRTYKFKCNKYKRLCRKQAWSGRWLSLWWWGRHGYATGPVYRSYESVTEKIGYKPRVIYLTPQGKVFNQSMAEEFSEEEDLVFLCGHYEGIDERVLEMIVTDNVSIGDYVLTGGELPSMVMIDAISRLVPGVLNNDVSAEFESFNDNLLEYPQYTRPASFMEREVPPILLSGNHPKVEEWRRQQSILRTMERRPDLMKKAELTKQDIKFIKSLDK